MVKKKQAVAPVATKAVMNWKDRLNQSVERERKILAELPADGGNFIGFGGGTITVGGNEMNPLKCVVLAQQAERAWYAGAYNSQSKELPSCFSLDMRAPHANSSNPQADTCMVCPKNQFGSAEQGGGKACKEGVKLALVPLDALDGPVYTTKKISWSSTKVWRNAAGAIGGDFVMYATQIKNRPDAKTQYLLSFAFEKLPVNDNVMSTIAGRLDEAERLVALPYPEAEDEAPKPSPSGRKSKFSK